MYEEFTAVNSRMQEAGAVGLDFQALSSNDRKNRAPMNRSRAALIGTVTARSPQGARSRRIGPETGYHSLSTYSF